MTKHILITGCSGGGKSTLLDALKRREHSVVPEPGLRIVREETEGDGAALPWNDLEAFLRKASKMAQDDLSRMEAETGPVFYDRGLLDAAVGLLDHCGLPLGQTLGPKFPYARRVIVAPPWRACYAETAERRHSFDDAVAEYQRIRDALEQLGCDIVELPFVTVEARANFVERAFDIATSRHDRD